MFKNDFINQSLALLPVFMTTIIFGSNVNWLMNATFYLTQSNHVPAADNVQCAYIASVHEVGRMLFALPSGFLIDKFGRKIVILALGCLNFVSWSMLTFSSRLAQIYICRFFLGIGTALCTCAYTVVIAELVSPEYRGTLSSINQLMIPVSGIMQSLVSVIFGSYQTIGASTAILCLCFFPSAYFLLESPYFLIGAGHCETAKVNLRSLRPSLTDAQLDDEFEALRTSIELEKSKRARTTFWQFVTAKSVRRSLACGILINGLHRFSGLPAMITYTTVVLPSNAYFSNSFYPLIAVAVSVFTQSYTTVLIDRYSRRLLYSYSTFLSFAVLIWCAVNYYHVLYAQHQLYKAALISAYLFVIVLNHTLLTPLTDIVTSELFPFTIKGKACGFVFFFRSIVTILNYRSFDAVQASIGVYANFVLYAVCSLGLIFVILFLVPETKGKTLAEVQFELGTISRQDTVHIELRGEKKADSSTIR